VKRASEPDEWEQAYQMVAANYKARGYEAPSPKQVRFTPYHALPDTVTFVAKYQGRVVATLSMVLDNSLLGLPIEAVYPDEIDELRLQGRRLVEGTSLADRDLSVREFLQVFVTILRVAMQWAANEGVDTYLITVNPRHRTFYRKAMGFVPLGPCRACPAVRDHPAEAFLLDTDLMRANAPAMYERIFGEWLPAAVFTGPRLPVHLARYFGNHSSQTDRVGIDRLFGRLAQNGNLRRWSVRGGSPRPALASC
jgi:hypothetical protein